MSKRYIKIAILLLLTLSVAFVLFACTLNDTSGKTDENDNTAEQVVESIRIDSSTIPSILYAGRVQLNDIMLIVRYNDGTQESVAMREDYIAVKSRYKLNRIGMQQLEVVYGSCTTSFQLNLLDPAVAVYTLVVEGGVPVSVNGEAVNVQPPEDGVFTQQYTGGTVVVIAWTPIPNKTFGSWEADNVSVDNQSTTTVHMNADHVYRAVSFDVVYTVNFITYKDNYNIASKDIKRLYDSSENYDKTNIYYSGLPSISMDDYVFAGWTLEEISRDISLSGSNAISLIEFDKTDESGAKYLSVDRDLTLYAVWTPIRLSFTSYTPSLSGFTQTTGYQVVRYEGTLTDLVIPETYGGMTVLSISRDTFTGENAAYIETITIPSGVVEIEEGTFKNCSSLRAIYVSQGSPIYTGENGVLYKDERATLVAYPANRVVRAYEMESTVSSISPYAFYNAIVGQIIVSSDVAVIGDHAFDSVHIDAIDFSGVAVNKLSSLKSHIGDNVFNEQLSSIVLTSSETDWDGFAALHGFSDFVDRFSNGTDVHRINTYYYSEDVVILFRIINGNNLATYFNNTGSTAEIIGVSRQLKEIVIPQKLMAWNTSYIVSSIGYYAFKDCKSLSSVTLPSDLERVCDKAFDDTPWAQKLNAYSIIANNILYKYLGNETSYNLPSDVTRIAESAFRGNKTLEFFNLSSNDILRDVSAMAFYGCENLKSFSETNNDFKLLIKSRLSTIGAYAFANTAIKYIESEGENSLDSVKEYAFADCRYLLSVKFDSPDLSEINSTAFMNAESVLLYSVTVKNDYFVTYNDVLYKMNGVSTAELYAYPSGKITDVFDPTQFTRKIVSVENGVFSVFGQEYSVETEDDDRIVGKYSETDEETGLENVTRFTLNKDQSGKGYINVRVNMIGANSLKNSNIGALVIGESIHSSEPIRVPGIVYVQIDSLSSMSYSYLFPSEEYEPKFVCFPTLTKSQALGFFNSNQTLCDEKYVSAVAVDFFTYDDGLYYKDGSDIVLARTRRDLDSVVIPDSVVYNATDYTYKTIGGYAFGGWYLTQITFGKDTQVLSSGAMGLTHRLRKVVFTENVVQNIPVVYSDSFGNNFNRGLLLYVEEGMADYYIEKWNTNNSENILATFNYYLDNVNKLACPYLIEDNKPFAQLTYRDDNGDVITVGNPIYGRITSTDIERFYNDDAVQKDGYVVGGWTDENDVDVQIGNSYVIPYNQILTCIWMPRVYRVYLNLNEDFVPNFGVEVAYSQEKRMYYLDVEYHSSYEWDLLGYDARTYYLNGWQFSGSFGVKSVGVKGTWSLVLDREADSGVDIVFTPDWEQRSYSMVYICEGPLSNQTVSVGYNDSYTLDLPTRDGYSFKGWYYVQPDNEELMLTNESGQSKLPWFLTVADNDTYRIYPKWQANSITVDLYLDDSESVLYDTVYITYDSEDYELLLNENILTQEQIDLFSGWADENGVIYTDSTGNATKKWDKSLPSKLYAVWPVAISTEEQLIAALTDSLSASIVLENDLVLTNVTFGALNRPYTGVFNGKGHTITYSNNDDATGFSGLFVRNDGTIKNLKLYVTSICRNIRTVMYGSENPVYIGTVCAVNNGTISSVDVEVVDFSITVDSQKFCFDDVNSAYHVGIVTAQNNGSITGTCTYYYYKDTTYYRDSSILAANYYENNEWSMNYSSFYLYQNGRFDAVSAPYDEEADYYTLDDGNFNLATLEAKRDYDNNLWDACYNKYYIGDDHTPVTVPFDSQSVYYNIVDDIFKSQSLFNVGTGTNKMSFTLKEHKTNN